MMFLSIGGKLISQHITVENRQCVTQQFDCSVRAMHDLVALHKDLMPRNILWNEETSQAMIIDFERAEVFEPRTVLGVISANRKRKRGSEGGMAKQRRDRSSAFAREMQRAVIELRGLT
jgi:serine/threonine protein kinase